VQLLTLGILGHHAEYLDVDAEEMVEYDFLDASAALERVCRDPEAEKWLKPFAQLKKPVYFVAGLQTLHNAKIRKAIGSRAGVEAYVTVPLEPSTQIPVNIQLQLIKTKTGISDGTVSGVFGIKILNGTWSTFKSSDEPRWAEKLYWKWMYGTKGPGTKDERNFTGLDIGEMDQADLEEMQKEKWEGEEEEEAVAEEAEGYESDDKSK
jgi:hypothetical protein